MSTTTKQPVIPTRPWAASPKDRAITALSVVIAAFISIAVVAATPMKGKLAYFFVFYISWIVVDSLIMYRKIGSKGLRDGLAAKITLFGGLVVLMAVGSILYATISRGIKGINFAFLTQTMHDATLFDPIGKGGIAHAIVGTLF